MAFFEKYIIIALLALVILVGGYALWQRAEVKSVGLAKANEEKAALQTQVIQAQKNVVAAQKAQAVLQKTADSMAQELLAAQTSDTKCVIGGNDEKILSDVTDYFNAHGVLPGPDSAKSNDKSVSSSRQAGAGKPNFTVGQVIQNYVKLVTYTVALENGTVFCYETSN